jgi:hypothetical protein
VPLAVPELVPLAPVVPPPVTPPELPEPLPAGPPELVLPELSPRDPLKPLSPLEEALPLELMPDVAPLAEDPLVSFAHAQMRPHAAARHAEPRMAALAIGRNDCRFKWRQITAETPSRGTCEAARMRKRCTIPR